MHPFGPYGPDAFKFIIPGSLIILFSSAKVNVNPCFFFCLFKKTCTNFEIHREFHLVEVLFSQVNVFLNIDSGFHSFRFLRIYFYLTVVSLRTKGLFDRFKLLHLYFFNSLYLSFCAVGLVD